MSQAGVDSRILDPLLINGVLILDNDGKRIACKYFKIDKSFDTNAQLAFEKRLFKSISRVSRPGSGEPECVYFEKYTVVFKTRSDSRVIVLAPPNENELFVLTVLSTIDDSIANLLNFQVTARALEEYLHYILLVIDEVLDDGLCLETDPANVLNRIQMHESEDAVMGPNDTSLSGAFKTVSDQLLKSLRK